MHYILSVEEMQVILNGMVNMLNSRYQNHALVFQDCQKDKEELNLLESLEHRVVQENEDEEEGMSEEPLIYQIKPFLFCWSFVYNIEVKCTTCRKISEV